MSEYPETEAAWRDLIARLETDVKDAQYRLQLALANFRAFQAECELERLKRSLARPTVSSPPPPVPVLADFIPELNQAPVAPVVAPAPEPKVKRKYTPRRRYSETIEEYSLDGLPWLEQVTGVRLWRENYPEAPINKLARALHLHPSRVSYILGRGKRQPSGQKPFPPLPEDHKVTPAPAPRIFANPNDIPRRKDSHPIAPLLGKRINGDGLVD